MSLTEMLTPSQRWQALKTRGGYTLAEIDAIDDATWGNLLDPWSEPGWWQEMMDARRALLHDS